MRIALNAQKLSFAHGYQAGGISRYIYHLLRELRSLPSGHRYMAFATQRPGDLCLQSTPSFSWHASGSRTEQPGLRILWEQVVLPLQAARADLLHGLAFALPLAWRKRSIVTVFDLSFARYPEHFNRGNRAYLALFTRAAVRQANLVLTISEHGRKEVVDLFGVPPERVVTTYCAADARFRPLESSQVEAFRQSRQLPERYILYLGTLEPRKNVVTLLRAYSLLRYAMANPPRLVLAGSPGWKYQAVFQTLDELRLREHVLLPGYVPGDEQPLWYNAAAVLAYPSVYEGFGLPPLEAMACGTPVVTSNATSLPEVVGDAGLQVHPFDEHALATSLQRVLEDPDYAATLRQAGLEQAARFSWRRMALETLRCYDDLAGGT